MEDLSEAERAFLIVTGNAPGNNLNDTIVQCSMTVRVAWYWY